MVNHYKIEICCGSLTDCMTAEKYPVDRIELNSGLELGGLTPSLSTFLLAKEKSTKKIVCMVRPRTAGFCYNNYEISTMFSDADVFLKNGADGIVFGFLNPNRTIDIDNTKRMVELIHSYQKEAVFHKAFDEVLDYDKAIEDLISCNVDRVLTSGTAPSVLEGLDVITHLEEKYGDQIEILPGCGIKEDNIVEILEKSKVSQFHMTAKSTFEDRGSYVAVDGRNVQNVLDKIGNISTYYRKELTGEDIAMMKNDPFEKEYEPKAVDRDRT